MHDGGPQYFRCSSNDDLQIVPAGAETMESSPAADSSGNRASSLLLGLEFLVAADVIRTVALELTPRNIGMLGALVVIRTFLSRSVVVETEGHWPWQPGPRGHSSG